MKMDMGVSSPSENEEPVRIDGEVNTLRWGVFPVKMAKTKKFMTIQPAFCQRLHCAGSDRVPDGGRDGIAA
jgi:hypothetical protein